VVEATVSGRSVSFYTESAVDSRATIGRRSSVTQAIQGRLRRHPKDLAELAGVLEGCAASCVVEQHTKHRHSGADGRSQVFRLHTDIRMQPVLVVEDDPECRVLLETWLRLLDVPVLTAHHGGEGLRVAREQKPCLILLDFMMPVMGGREFRLIQAADPAISDVPVVLTSAHPRAREFATELHLDGVVEKPVSADEIQQLVKTFCLSTGEQPMAPSSD